MKTRWGHRVACLCWLAFGTDCEGVTGSRRIAFSLAAQGVAEASKPFVTCSGWRITLSSVRMALGPVYFNVAPPLSGPTGALCQAPRATPRTKRPPSLLQRVSDALLPAAHADETADHLAGGRTIAQVTSRVLLDVLSPTPMEVGAGDGTDEHALTAEVGLWPSDAAGQSASLPDRAVVEVLGQAERASLVVPFLVRVILDEQAAVGQSLGTLRTARRLTADVDFSRVQEGQANRVLLRVDPREWFAQADFTAVADRPREQGRVILMPTDQVYRVLREGLRLTQGVYLFSLQ